MKAAGILFVSSITGNALFLRRASTAHDTPGMWDFPGGGQEGDETAEQTAIRETREEIGFLPDGIRIPHTRTRSGSALQGVAGPGAPPLGNPVDGGASTAIPMMLDDTHHGIVRPVISPEGSALKARCGGPRICHICQDEQRELAAASPSIVPAIPVDVDYTTFLQRVTNEFTPELDGEHDGYAWSPLAAPPEPLHPGCRIALERLAMDELDVARAISTGQLTSPQRYENVMLWAIRITGTGASFRPKSNEYVYRDEEIHTNERALARCNGLPVIFKHPAKALLNSEEFANRIVGTIFLPYVAGDEVWGIAKIYDDETNRLLDEETLSTSPGVNFKDFKVNRSLRMEDGSKVLIEGKPSLVDHIAICELGVWDKGGDPSGVRSESREDSAMTEEEKKAAADKARKDAEEAETKTKKDAADKEEAEKKAKEDAVRKDADAGKSLDDKLSHVLDAVTGCMDAVKRVDARMDAMDEEKKKADAAKSDAGMTEAEKTAADKAKKDADEKAEEEKKKADAAKKDEEEKAKADSAGLGDRIAAVERAVKATDAKIMPIPDDDHSLLADAWAIADDACRALGMNGPRAMPGETSGQFRRRVVKLLKPHSTTYKAIEFPTGAMADDAFFQVIERTVLSEAAKAARDPSNVAGDKLRMIERKQDGHTIREFVGRPDTWMNQFAGPVQLRGEGKFLTDGLGKN